MLLDPLAYTCTAYSQLIGQRLGRGVQHAALLYRQYCRRSSCDLTHPLLCQAPALVEQILSHTTFTLPQLVQTKVEGGTTKFLLRTHDALETESVIIPMPSGATLCLSSQVGCRLGCTFCTTGRMGLIRHLSVAEIVAQLFTALHLLQQPIRNVVFMGMGEPFDNYDAVVAAARIMSDSGGFALGAKHMTISTSGLIEGIARLAGEEAFAPHLAVSLTAPTDALRSRLMPINRRYPLATLYSAMAAYCQATRRQILIAYVLLDGVNDSPACAEALADYLEGLAVKVNLIPYNPQPRDRFRATPPAGCAAFAAVLRQRGYQTLLRQTRGQSITAACGQLGNLALRRQLTPLQIYSSHPASSAL